MPAADGGPRADASGSAVAGVGFGVSAIAGGGVWRGGRAGSSRRAAQISHDTSPRRPPSAVINRASSTCTSGSRWPRPSLDLSWTKTRAASRRRPARFSRRSPSSIGWPVSGTRRVDGVEVASFPTSTPSPQPCESKGRGRRGAGRRAGDEDDDVLRARRRDGFYEGAALDLRISFECGERVLQ